MKEVPSKNRIRGSKETAPGQAGHNPSGAVCPCCSCLPVRRRSGRAVVLGLLLGAGLVQVGLVVSFHWDDWHQQETSTTIWDSFAIGIPASPPQSNGIVSLPGKQAFFPPPGWDNGVLTRNVSRADRTSDDPLVTTPSFTALLDFLHSVGDLYWDRIPGRAQSVPHRERSLASFQQASSQTP